MENFDDAIVGGGILGLAHAYQLGRRGRRVVVFERDRAAQGASIRNFGMLWPIGQPRGDLRRIARSSVRTWLEVLSSAGLWHRRSGSLHLAYHDDEARVLEEFVAAETSAGETFDLVEPGRVLELAPAVRNHGLLLALWSPDEVCVDPREVVAGLPVWLERQFGVVFRFEDPVVEVRSGSIVASRGTLEVERIWICCGDELRGLFPDLLRQSGLVRCKLQMMRSQAYGPFWSIGPMLAAGLTLRHYAAFRECPGLAALAERVSRESPWLDRYGIHVLVSQNGRGEIIIGDSHEYDPEITPFDKSEIERYILDYLQGFLDVPELSIAARWHGTYARHPERPYVVLSPRSGVVIVTGVGGAGMTLSFGLAERVVEQVLADAGGFVSSGGRMPTAGASDNV